MFINNELKIELKAYAKINLFLEVLNKRDDGYHELVTLMQEVDLYDDIVLEEIDNGISIICNDPSIPVNDENLIWKAADLFKKRYGINKGVKIQLNKRIPSGAGLGGGSSDAATTLKGLNILWKTEKDDHELTEIASEIGSDVPFFIKGQSAICKGRGEKVTPVLITDEYIYVIIFPNLKINTVDIYKNLKLGLTKDWKDVSFLLRYLQKYNPEIAANFLFNRLEETVYRLYPDLLKLKTCLDKLGFCKVQVSGSGSSLFGLCERRCDAEDIRNKLHELCSAKIFVVSNIRN